MHYKAPTVIHSNIATLAEGFPDLKGYDIHVISLGDDTTPTKTIMLQFSRCNANRTILEEIHVYLLNSEYECANFESKGILPRLMNYRIEKQQDTQRKKPMKLLVLDFESGNLSFAFEKVFHTTSSYKIR